MNLRFHFSALVLLLGLLCGPSALEADAQTNATLQLAVMKYKGGGDWYSNPSAIPNLAKYCNSNLGTNLSEQAATVEPGSPDLFNYPFIHLTGHGNVVFSAADAENLRNYLIGGGFLHISDNYGLDVYIRPQMKKVFPEAEFIEIPFSHPVYHAKFPFKNGLPKIHEHDNKAPQGFGLLWDGKLVCFYDYECDLSDGWEDREVHRDSEDTRIKALKMGANLVTYAFDRPE